MEDNLFADEYLPCILAPDYKVSCARDCGNCDFPFFVKSVRNIIVDEML